MLLRQEDCCLAIWLSQLLSQVISPRPASTLNYTSRRNSFNIENNDLTTTTAASENSDGFHQQAAASGSPQRVPASVVNPWLGADTWSSTRKLVRGIESLPSVEGTLSRGKRDQDLEGLQSLSERKNLHVYLEQKAELAVQGECQAQKRLSEAEAQIGQKKLGTKMF